jgi:hypothetical protein
MAKQAEPVGVPQWQGDHWTVRSSRGDRCYVVKPDGWDPGLPGWFTCECAWWTFRGWKERRDCKHIAAVRLQLLAGAGNGGRAAAGNSNPAE